MMSETRARASRLARWSGSLDRNGFSGRRAPLSPPDWGTLGGVAGGRGGAGARAGVAEGTNGAAGVCEASAIGRIGGAGLGAGAAGPDPNSGILDPAEAGVAVAVEAGAGACATGAWRC